jgi:hypothetical protein
MEAFIALAISLGLLVLILFGVIVSVFLMFVGLAFGLVVEGLPRRSPVARRVAPPRVATPVLLPRRRRGDWERERAA